MFHIKANKTVKCPFNPTEGISQSEGWMKRCGHNTLLSTWHHLCSLRGMNKSNAPPFCSSSDWTNLSWVAHAHVRTHTCTNRHTCTHSGWLAAISLWINLRSAAETQLCPERMERGMMGLSAHQTLCVCVCVCVCVRVCVRASHQGVRWVTAMSCELSL